MPTKAQARTSRSSSKQQQQVSTVTLPLIHAKVMPEHLAYFGALGVLGALELIEWPLVAVLVAGNVIATRAHRQVVRELAAGVDEAV
jgi:hypothetical protein